MNTNQKYIEFFHAGGAVSDMGNDDKKLVSWPESDEASYTRQMFCRNRNLKEKGKNKTNLGGEEGERQDRFYPKEGQSTWGKLNPIWLILSLLNVCLEIVIDLYSVFFFLFKIVFRSTFKSLTDWDLGELVGFKQGTKNCYNLLWFRYFVTILCPPAGVFMASGFSGWLQIIICCLASLFYYFPGLVYALIVINRSSVAEYMKFTNSTECNDDMGGGGLYVSTDEDNNKKCTIQVGEACEPTDADKCCANPYFVTEEGEKTALGTSKVKYGKGKWLINDAQGNPVEARDKSGRKVTGPNQGLIYCRKDTKKIDVSGMCVWKENKKPG